jgi:hypothetical protein
MRQSTIWVLLLAAVLIAHGGFTLASTMALEDKVARLEAVIEMQGDASSDLNSCTEVLTKAVRHASLPKTGSALHMNEAIGLGAGRTTSPGSLVSTHQ